ncbi:NUDIX domain-containing protein [Cellulomonas wangsupingiae]|uniref:NUDIX hydrolase n=1 Tax=Cellulomonas wangsupingiae TaxID=2968085 RepID=A0ABY5K4Z6_9CELL|nr:NUDIX hydrolase [Cellulomonas wangsupingiae]MCC2334077.1 NUDIX hydrolase [Cellulomonas wangsupingiae]MCM0641044.1 NUDIX hydrolase [Cellulomonas wangsupingiae]UUI65324.1 NUDIX hydrolase [Cellulomonas wangsupingiae]
MGWQTVSSRVVHENAWITVRQDDVLAPDGRPGQYGVVEVRPSVFVVALTDDDEVVLVTTDRYTTGPGSVEVPAGGTDGQEPLVAAQRELAEEVGLVARDWTPVGTVDALNGVARAVEHVFVARRLSPVADADATGREQAAEGITAVRTVPFADALAMVRSGEIRDGETVAALALAALHLGRLV